jgi:hypothetical protein
MRKQGFRDIGCHPLEPSLGIAQGDRKKSAGQCTEDPTLKTATKGVAKQC